MSAVTIYMEGGGDKKGTRIQLRDGMVDFLKRGLNKAANAKKRKLNIVCCGDRRRTYYAFRNARKYANGDEVVILLVDAEDPVTSLTVVEHLKNRSGDGWDLTGVPENYVHLMVQTMETWIVADKDALSDFYGQGFHENFLPLHENLEEVSKRAVANALVRATKKTRTKGPYHKIRHASQLLKLIDPGKVQERCSRCELLFSALGEVIEAG